MSNEISERDWRGEGARTETKPSPTSLAALGLGFWRVVNEQSVQSQRIWEDDVADGTATHGEGVKTDGLAALNVHLHRLEMRVLLC